MILLDRVQAFVDASNSTNSNTDKLNVIKEFSQDAEVMKMLRYVYHPTKQFHVSSEGCKKRSELISYGYKDIFTLLDDLATRTITGHTAIAAVNGFVSDNPRHVDLIWNILDRNLKTRSTTSMINKVVPGLIPTFDVALAKAYDEKTQKKVDWNDGWYMSRKIDGTRCLCVIDETGTINFFSRQGKEFETLDNVRKALEPHGLRKIVLDGEICLLDEDGNENFQGIIKEIKRKEHTIEKPKFLVFDILHQDEFNSGTSERTFSERHTELKSFVDIYNTNGVIDYVDQIRVKSDQDLQEYVDLANKHNWEGLMLRKDVGYKGKRSTDVLKVKKFHDAEYTVVAVESDLHRVVVDGQEVEEEMLSHVIVEHRGNRVQVGSGFNHEQKRYYFEHPEEIIGKEVTVSYFEETHNQNGGTSLRFPTFKGVYEGKRDF